MKFSESITAIISTALKRSLPSRVNFVLIWGASATGKSTLAEILTTRTDDSGMVSVDSYLTESLHEDIFNHKPENTNIPYLEGLDPKIWDIPIMNKDLLALSSGADIKIPIYNHTNKKREGYRYLTQKKIIFLEGAYSMESSISKDAVLSIMIYADLHDRLVRKLVRTLVINQRDDIDSSIHRYLMQTNTSLKYYENLYKKRVDFIIYNPLNPTLEFNNLPSMAAQNIENYTILRPKKSTGSSKPGEILKVNLDRLELNYCINGRVLFSHVITIETYKLLLTYYIETRNKVANRQRGR